MCTPTSGAMLPYGLKIPSPYFPFGSGGGVAPGHLPSLDFQRSQINDYNVRVQLGLRNYQHTLGLSPFHAYLSDPYTQAYFYKHDPRARFVQEEPKPSHSYIGLIGMAILQSKDKKLVLSDIYQWILDNYAYFRTRGPGWRNSIRHNLSLNDCFIKSGRSANGKGHYWAVHPANVDDFERGDFRRRRAQRKVRRHMGLSVPDDDDSPSPSPTQPWAHHDHLSSPDNGDRASSLDSREDKRDISQMCASIPQSPDGPPRILIPHPPHLPHPHSHHHHHHQHTPAFGLLGLGMKKPSRKRLFDMASLLAPDDEEEDLIDAKVRSEKIYENNSASPGSTRGNTDELRREESMRDNNSQDNNKYNEEGNDKNTIIRLHTFGNRDISDDEGDNEDDDDNGQEIHVTSDDESSAEQSAIANDKCDKESRVSVERDVRYSETDNHPSGTHHIYGIRTKYNISHDNKEDDTSASRPSIINGIVDKENISKSHIQEIYPKSHNLDNDINGHDSGNEDSDSELHGHQNIASKGLRTVHSPTPDIDRTQSSSHLLNHDQRTNNTAYEQRSTSVSPSTHRPDHLTIPLSITVNTANFSSPIFKQEHNTSFPRRLMSETSEPLSSQTSLLFMRGSPYKGEVAKLADGKLINGGIGRSPLDQSPVQIPDNIMRLQTDSTFNWQSFPKELIRERYSAFNVLDGRSHSLVGHFHQGAMRAIPPFSTQTILAHSSALTQGIPSPLPASRVIHMTTDPSLASVQQHNERMIE